MTIKPKPPEIRELANPSQDWKNDAGCLGPNSTLFHNPHGERDSTKHMRTNAAKRICRECPVQMDCLRSALDNREPSGVWGGKTEDERRAILAAIDDVDDTSEEAA